MMVRADIDDELHSGRLLPLLPDWQLPSIDVWAVTPQRDRQPAKVRNAITALAAHFRSVPGRWWRIEGRGVAGQHQTADPPRRAVNAGRPAARA
jgi:hypothetical protein